jgi:hypothetical protein
VAPRCKRQRQGRPGKPGPLLGIETWTPGLPCTISVPNLMTDRSACLLPGPWILNVRRLMYQSLIWVAETRDDASGLRAPLHAQRLKRAPYSLIDGVRRYVQLSRDLLRGEVLVDEQQAIQLPTRELGHPLRHRLVRLTRVVRSRRSVHARSFQPSPQ